MPANVRSKTISTEDVKQKEALVSFHQMSIGRFLTKAKKVKDGYVHSCGTDIMGKELYLTVRDGVFGLSGSGETRPETVPYCPKCEMNQNQVTSLQMVIIIIN